MCHEGLKLNRCVKMSYSRLFYSDSASFRFRPCATAMIGHAVRAAARPALHTTVAGCSVLHVSSGAFPGRARAAAAPAGGEARRIPCNNAKPLELVGRAACAWREGSRAMSAPRAAERDQVIPFNLADIGEGITGELPAAVPHAIRTGLAAAQVCAESNVSRLCVRACLSLCVSAPLHV